MNTDEIILPDEEDINPLLPLPETLNIHEWMFSIIRPYLKGPVLELGSANDDIIASFERHGLPLHLTTSDRDSCDMLRAKYANNSNIYNVHTLNLRSSNFDERYHDRLGMFKTIFKLNASIKLPLDYISIHNAKLLLKPRGRLILLLPVRTTIYSLLQDDPKAINAVNRRDVRSLLGSDMEVQKTKYFTLRALPGTNSEAHSGLSLLVVAKKIDQPNGLAQ